MRRAIPAGTVRHQRDGWAIFVDVRDVGEIELKPRGQEGTDRVAVMVRPERSRYEAWERAAGDKPVSTWLGELADAAVKRGGELGAAGSEMRYLLAGPRSCRGNVARTAGATTRSLNSDTPRQRREIRRRLSVNATRCRRSCTGCPESSPGRSCVLSSAAGSWQSLLRVHDRVDEGHTVRHAQAGHVVPSRRGGQRGVRAEAQHCVEKI